MGSNQRANAPAPAVVYTVQERRRVEGVAVEPYFGPMSALCCIFPGMAFPCIMWPMLVICPLDHREVVVTAPDGAVITAQQIQLRGFSGTRRQFYIHDIFK